MLAPLSDWKVVEGGIKELNRTVAASDSELVGVRFAEGYVEEGVLRVEPAG
jgi:hypothetical protein